MPASPRIKQAFPSDSNSGAGILYATGRSWISGEDKGWIRLRRKGAPPLTMTIVPHSKGRAPGIPSFASEFSHPTDSCVGHRVSVART